MICKWCYHDTVVNGSCTRIGCKSTANGLELQIQDIQTKLAKALAIAEWALINLEHGWDICPPNDLEEKRKELETVKGEMKL